MTKFIYLIRSEETQKYKIGVAQNIEKRLDTIQTGNHEKLTVIKKYKTKHPFLLEKSLHRYFNNKNEHLEWFNLDISDTIDFIDICKKLEKDIIFILENNTYVIDKMKK